MVSSVGCDDAIHVTWFIALAVDGTIVVLLFTALALLTILRLNINKYNTRY